MCYVVKCTLDTSEVLALSTYAYVFVCIFLTFTCLSYAHNYDAEVLLSGITFEYVIYI